MLKPENKVPPIKISFRFYAKSIRGVDENKVATYLLNMKFDGYFKFYPAPAPANDELIEITNKGIAAYMGKELLTKNNDIFWKGAMNIGLTVANIAVAITAIWAITKDSGEIQLLKDRMRKLEQGANTIQEKANPNNQHLLNSGQPNTINLVDTQKIKGTIPVKK